MRANFIPKAAAPAFVAVGLVALVSSCLSSGGGSAAISTIGGAEGTQCNTEYHTKGCNGTSRVECKDAGDGTGAKWVKIDDCGQGKYCAEEDVPGAAQPTMKNPVCKDVPTGGGGGGGGGVTDGGPAKTPQQQLACAEAQCATEIAACMANTECAAAMNCAKACADQKCIEDTCPSLDGETPAGQVFLGVFGCAVQKGCIAVCGNDKCEAGENKDNCDDCKPKAVCGDGTCADTETEASCPADCKTVSTPVCGDGKCEAPEGNATCAQDCKAGGPVCGNGTCEEGESQASCAADCKPAGGGTCGDFQCSGGETKQSCALDCDDTASAFFSCAKAKCGEAYGSCTGDVKCATALQCIAGCGPENESCNNACFEAAGVQAYSKLTSMLGCAMESCGEPTGPVCGDGKCEGSENVENCSKDCKPGGPVCGNNKCESGETKQSCPGDCGSPGPVCGNETCEAGESYSSCPADCPCTSDAQCGSGKTCAEGTCINAGGGATCGDMVCSSGEQCLMDCDAEAKAGAQCAMSNCSSQWNACKNDSQCWGALQCVSACTKGDESCANNCVSKYPGAITKGQPLGECTQSKCGGGGGTCGDGTCDSNEDANSCPADCASTGGSCVGKCGGQGSGGCYCDSECEKYGDCCPDFKQVCP